MLRRYKRQKYRCSCGGCVETALDPPKLQPGESYSVDFAVHVAVAKYLDHMPLERQVKTMAREGLVVVRLHMAAPGTYELDHTRARD